MWRIEACVGRIPSITDGLTSAGLTTDGLTTDGFTSDGFTSDGLTTDGLTTDGLITDGLTASLCRPELNCWSLTEVLIIELNNLELVGN